MSVPEAEALHTDEQGGRPFGGAHDAWVRLRDQLRPGDQLWLYESGAAGPGGCANSGVAILRHGSVAAHLLVRIG